MPENKTIHLSFDDTYLCLKNLIVNRPESIFNDSFLAYLKKLHDLFGAKFILYVTEEIDSYKITDVPTIYKDEFKENNSWIRFGYHSINTGFNKDDTIFNFKRSMQRVNDAVVNFGGKLTSTVRLHYYFATEEMENDFMALGGKVLLGPDDRRKAYSLTHNESDLLFRNKYFSKNGIKYIKTDLRIEKRSYVLRLLQKCNDSLLVIFSHEQYVQGVNKIKLYYTCKWLVKKGYKFSFLE